MDIVTNVNNIVKSNIHVFSLIVLTQGLFGGRGLLQMPQKLNVLFEHAWVRFLALMLIALTASKDLKTALIATCIFVLSMHVLRSDEERLKMKNQLF